MKIWLVDDDKRNMGILLEIFKRMGHEVDHFHNIIELKENINKNRKYDGIIIDLFLPIDDELSIAEDESEYLAG